MTHNWCNQSFSDRYLGCFQMVSDSGAVGIVHVISSTFISLWYISWQWNYWAKSDNAKCSPWTWNPLVFLPSACSLTTPLDSVLFRTSFLEPHFLSLQSGAKAHHLLQIMVLQLGVSQMKAVLGGAKWMTQEHQPQAGGTHLPTLQMPWNLVSMQRYFLGILC